MKKLITLLIPGLIAGSTIAQTPDYTVSAPYTSPTRNTCGAVNNCTTYGSEDHIYQVSIPGNGAWTFSLCGGATWDTRLLVGTTVCGTNIGNNDDFCGLQSQITSTITTGTYYVTIEGFSTSDCGNYILNISGPVPNDVGVIAIDAPTSSCGLTSTESVTIRVKNFGTNSQSNIPVFYNINGGGAITGSIPGPLPAGDTAIYTFAATADLSSPGVYIFDAWTSLVGDADNSNDSLTNYQVFTNQLVENVCIIDFDSSSFNYNCNFTNNLCNDVYAWGDTTLSTSPQFIINASDIDSITFFLYYAECGFGTNFILYLNGIQIGTFTDSLGVCSCTPFIYPIIYTITDSVVLNAAWDTVNTLSVKHNGTDMAVAGYSASIYAKCLPSTFIEVTNDTAICTGDSVNLTVTITDSVAFPAPYAFLWSPAVSLSCSACQSPIANPASTTTYMVTVTDSTGAQDSAFVTVTVFSSLPVADAGPDTAICEKETAQLNATGGVYYSWSPAFALSDTNIANPYANPVITTTYIVIVSNGCGSDVDTVTVFVNPLPVLISTDTAVCPGDTVQLNASGGVSYLWSPGSGLSDSTIANPVASPFVSTNYILLATSGSGCTLIGNVGIIVASVPQILATTSQDTICPGGSAQLSVNACTPMNDDFDPAIDFPLWDTIIGGAATTSCGSVSGLALYFNGAGTRQAISQNLNVLTGGTVDFFLKIGSGASPCENADSGEDIVLAYSTDNGITWNNINTYFTTGYSIFTAISENIPAGAQTAGTQFRWRQSSFSGSGFDNWAIDDVSIACSGPDTTLSYTWTPSTGLTNPNIANPIASPSSTTAYIVSANIGSCSSSDTITIYVDTSNFITATPLTAICEGDSVQLSVTGSTGLPDDSLWTYAWSPGNTLTDSTADAPLAFPASATTYQITVSNLCGNFTDTVTVTVNPAPTVDAGVDTSFCFGGSVNLEALGAISFVWSPAAGLTCTACAKPTASPASTTTYYVTGTAANGCTNTDSIKITVNGLPITAISSSDSICPGDTTQLNVVAGGTSMQDDFDPNIDFPLWDTIIGGAATASCGSVSGLALYFNGAGTRQAITQNLNVLMGGTVDFSLKIGSGASPCEDAETGENIVLEYSTDNGISWNNINTYLTTGYITFTAISENIPAGAQTAGTQFRWRQVSFSGSGFDNWAIDDVDITTTGGTLDSTVIINWSPSTGLSNPNIANPVASPAATTTYIVAASSGGCSATDTITIYTTALDVVAGAGTSLICSGDTAQLNATANIGGASFSWSPAAGLSCTNCPNPLANPSSTTMYYVTATSGPCTDVDSVLLTIGTGPITSCTPTTISYCCGMGIYNVTFNTINNTTPNGVEGYQDYSCTNATNLIVDQTYSISVQTGTGLEENVRVWIDYNNNGVFANNPATELVFWSDSVSTNHSGTVTIPMSAVINTPLRMRVASDYYGQPAPVPCNNVTYGQVEDYTVIILPNTIPPVADFDITIFDTCQGIVSFTDQSSYNPTSWFWDFGDGSGLSTSQNPYYVYGIPGTYTVTLIVTNPYGTDTITGQVVINSLTADFTVSSNSVGIGELVNFYDNSTGAVTWQWDFGDGYFANIPNPSHSYLSAGTYTVTLIASNASGCIAQMMQDIMVCSSVPQTGAIIGPVNVSVSDTAIYSVPFNNWSIYDWTIIGGSQISGGQTNVITVQWTSSVIGQVNVVETDTLGCSGAPVSLIVNIGGVGMDEIGLKDALKIYPNPGVGKFTLEIYDLRSTPASANATAGKIYDLRIYDALGREIHKSKIVNQKSEINLSGEPAGIYHLQLITDRGIAHRKVVIE